MTISIVVAFGANRVIGVDGDLPWRLSADLAHFKAVTLGHPMVMGRATFDSIGRPLPGRTSIVVTRDREWSHDGVIVAHSIEEALDAALELDDDVFVIGGAQIYEQTLDTGRVDQLIVTRVADAPDGDTFFPAVDWESWQPVVSIPHAATPDTPAFEIVTYAR